MIPKSCKRLAEVDFPIAEVSKHAAREKRHGHPSTLHLWWARRPLASSRAILLALLWPDPCDPNCPADFKEKAREMLPRVQGRVGKSDEDLRKALLKFIGDFANWDLSRHRDYLETSRVLVKVAHGGEIPLVVDPFAGGGSIPLEALRVGCDVFASDLNPVAVLINKVLLEYIPRNGQKLAEELQQAGKEIKEKLIKEIGGLYPENLKVEQPIAYIWSRTVFCESPNCGAEIPLVPSFWLCKKPKSKRALKYKIRRKNGKIPEIQFEIFKPNSENEVPSGNISRAKATCLVCGIVVSNERLCIQLKKQKGGSDVIFDENGKRIGGARLLAVVTIRNGEVNRVYHLPEDKDYEKVWNAQKKLENLLKEHIDKGIKSSWPIPDEPLPPKGTLGFRIQRYGMIQWGDLFNQRQRLVLMILSSKIREVSSKYSDNAVGDCLSLSVGKLLRHCNVVSKWHRKSETVAGAFGMQTVPMSWEFPEMFPLTKFAGGLDDAINDVVEPINKLVTIITLKGQAQIADAAEHPLPNDSVDVWFTDPPYYDAIPYSDLSDFFFTWLKRMLPDNSLTRDPFDNNNPLSPKKNEIVQDESKKDNNHVKDRLWFEGKMSKTFLVGNRLLKDNGVASIVFAHKTTEGWEALLSGLINGGWVVTGSWPVATERGARLRARESAALETSVHLICRPRPKETTIGDWGRILRELPKRVGDWMEYLQSEGVRGADLVFACIGPALEIFSRYGRVETAEGEQVKLSVYLEKVWEVVGRIALENILGTDEAKARNGVAGALEEDARLTALFLWTVQSTKIDGKTNGNGGEQETDADDEDEEVPASKKGKGYSLVFDVVRRFAQPLGINLPKWEKRIIETQKGVVRLLPITERAKILFGKDGAQTVAAQLEMSPTIDTLQQSLFPEYEVERPKKSKRKGRKKTTVDVSGDSFDAQPEATTLDRLHAAMILQASGRTNALRTFLKEEIDRNPDFLRLANALSALYPRGSEEKRLLDAMLLAVRK